ncbi:hypothetical protein BRC81_00260 [Halobacteriales archaeon QS_1_68_20]|nr:MAG: hypothetical protein BRC81_00260 [Halobacteriales archaeon QS_1_68_20]
MADGKVRYVGEPIALVVAIDRYAAEDAVERIDVEYEPLDHVVDPLEAREAETRSTRTSGRTWPRPSGWSSVRSRRRSRTPTT